MDGAESLEEHAARLRADNALGRSSALHKLFEFLLERSRDGDSPKEIEVAVAVFGRGAGFDVSQDASVRVYVHRLRRKLDEYYAGPGRAHGLRLVIPKGEYRVVVRERGPDDGAEVPAEEIARPWWSLAGRPWIALAVALLAVNLMAWAGWVWFQSAGDAYAPVRRNPAWAALMQNDKPVTVVVGDYYIFGETDDLMEVTRLVREFSINSPEDLAEHLMRHPELAGRYADVDLHYLPVASAFALRNVLPLLASGRQPDPVRVVLASDLTPDMIKRSNIVYIGYLSGLGILRGPVFAGSRFQVGDTYDELLDVVTRRKYVSQEGAGDPGGQPRRDYGYFSTFAGPTGNRIVVIAGTRDIAVMQTAEAVTNAAALKALAAKTGRTSSVEALYEVEGIRRINLGGRLLVAAPIKSPKTWSGDSTTLKFPAG